MINQIIQELNNYVNSGKTFSEKWYERLRDLREDILKVSQSEMSSKLGITLTALSRYERGRGANELTPKFRKKIANAFGDEVAEWIATGKLPKPKEKIEYIDTTQPVSASVQSVQIVELPFYPDVYASAGGGAYNYAEAAKKISFTKDFLVEFLGLVDFEGLHIITAVGDSMAPTIESGDRLYVLEFAKEENILRDGAIYVISYSSGVVVKRVYVRKDHIVLHSDNPNIPDEVLSGDELASATIIGRVVGSTKKF